MVETFFLKILSCLMQVVTFFSTLPNHMTTSFYLTTVARISNTELNRRSKNGHPFSWFWRKTFQFFKLGMMLAVDLLWMAFFMLRYFSSMCTLVIVFFFSWIGFEFCHFFCIYWGNHVILILHFVIAVYNNDLWMLNHPCDPGKKLDHGVWSFLYFVEFGLLILCWGCLNIYIYIYIYIYSSEILAYNFLFCMMSLCFGIKVMMTS